MPCAFKIEQSTSIYPHLPIHCQFGVSEDDLLTVDGIGWCIYHFPMNDENEKPTDKSSWDKKKLETFHGEIDQLYEDSVTNKCLLNLAGVIFPGDMNFNSKNFFYDTSFINATFSGLAKFKQSRCYEKAEFSGTRFMKHADFHGATFGKETLFESATFDGEAIFLKARFNGKAGFNHAVFGEDAIFSHSMFQNTNFQNTTFRKKAHFSQLKFSMDTFFNYAEFMDSAFFQQSVFERQAEFEDVMFNQNASFSESRFIETVSFNNSKFAGIAFFHDATFNSGTLFRFVKFAKEAFFDSSEVKTNENLVKGNEFNYLNFSGAVFEHGVSFINRQFRLPAIFENCIFGVKNPPASWEAFKI